VQKWSDGLSDFGFSSYVPLQVDTTVLGLDEERAKDLPYIASMGIYVISRDAMLKLLREDFIGANDFGSEVIPGATEKGMKVSARNGTLSAILRLEGILERHTEKRDVRSNTSWCCRFSGRTQKLDLFHVSG
jgi:hypothetical protein